MMLKKRVEIKPIALLIIGIIGVHAFLFSQISSGGSPSSFFTKNKSTKTIPIVILPPVDVVALQKEDAITDSYKDIPWRFGYNIPVNLNLSNSGIWDTLANGDRMWRLTIVSEGALSINLTFDDYYLPEGAKLFLYNENKTDIIGALTHKNNKPFRQLGTSFTKGDKVILEYIEPKSVAFNGSISINQVTHGYRNVFSYPFTKSLGGSQSCNNNVVCSIADPWRKVVQSVAMIIANGNTICIGALINNTCEDETPYMLFADHCLKSDPSTWVFRFNWESPICTPTLDGPKSHTISGAMIRARNDYTDFALIELSTTPPKNYKVYYSGWDNTGRIPSTTATIHHPNGDIKKISIDNDPAKKVSLLSIPQAWKINWDDGTTELGSSGAPLFDSSSHIIGQLYGGYASCSKMDSSDYFGRFEVSWDYGGSSSNQLKNWLDACGTGDTILAGYEPPIYALDVAATAIIEPSNGSSTCNTSFIPEIIITNEGGNTLNKVTINYQVNSGTINSYNWTGSLIRDAYTTVSLPQQTLDTGLHTITVFITQPNDNIDQNTSNDSSVIYFTIYAPSTVPIPLTEGFEGSTFPPTNWTINNPDGNDTWARVDTVSGFEESTACALMNNFTNDLKGQSDYLVTPYLDFASVGTTLTLYFNVAHARYDSINIDSLIIELTADCGMNWQRIYAKGGDQLSTTNDTVNSFFEPNAMQWRTDSIDLSSFIGLPHAQIAFRNISGFGNNSYLDDIMITTLPNSINKSTKQQDGVIIYSNERSVYTLHIKKEDVVVKKISVMNVLGQCVWKKTINAIAKNTKIDLTPYNKGIYFVEVVTDNGVFVEKLLNQ